MFDIKWIRENPDIFDQALAKRRAEPAARALIGLDARRRDALTRAQEIQAERNRLAKEIGAAKARGEDAAGVIAKVSQSKQDQADAEEVARQAETQLDAALAALR